MWLDRLRKITKSKAQIIAGIMSGTSADAIDVAICEFLRSSNKPRLVSFYSRPMPKLLKGVIRKGERLVASEVAELNFLLGHEFFEALKSALTKARLAMNAIDLIGSHGQTIYHHSGKSGLMSTLQVADGDIIATRSGVPVFSDFRMKDISLGGEGAPLTPYVDAVMFGASKIRAVLNLGGIANLTLIQARSAHTLGFDVGPANAPLDRLVRIITNGRESFDRNGKRASSGKVNIALLKSELAKDLFLRRKPPKSAGVELYGDDFVEKLIQSHGRADNDLLATVVEMIATSIGRAFNTWAKAPELVIAGGGAKNLFLVKRITELVNPANVLLSDRLGVPSEARESMAFAVLAREALFGVKAGCHMATGASRESILGKLSLPD